MKAVLEGLNILLKYRPDGKCQAAHDTLYASGPKPETMLPEDAKKLEELRWSWCDTYECWKKFT